jgi:hypothetical protein
LGAVQRFDVFERADEAGSKLVEFAGVVCGQFFEDALAFGCDLEEDTAAIGGIGGAGEEAFGHAAINQLDDGVMTQAKAFGGVADGGGDAIWGTRDLEQELVLARVEMDLGGGLFAGLEEGAEVEAEVGESLG